MDARKKVPGSHDAMIFGASEYAKDGLTPIVEITGPKSPWFARMRGIIDDIFKHARVETPYGKIPSKNIEVNGELLQMLPRLYCVTGEKKYLDWAHRLADYYLLPGKFVPGKLQDHGCEIIGGLGLLFAIDAKAAPEKCKQYEPHLRYMFDEIVRRGTNSDGVIVGALQPGPGPHDNVRIGDGWGYDFVGFLDYDLAMHSERYSAAIRKPLKNLLKPRYERFNWDHHSRDNVADSVEGGLYLLRRFPTPEGFVWADREIATLLVDHTQPDRLWGTHKLEANTGPHRADPHDAAHPQHHRTPLATGHATGSRPLRRRNLRRRNLHLHEIGRALRRPNRVRHPPAPPLHGLHPGLAPHERGARVVHRRAGRRTPLHGRERGFVVEPGVLGRIAGRRVAGET